MKALKILVVMVVLTVITGVVVDTYAQCFPGRLFRSSGKFGTNVKVDVTGASDAAFIGRLWDTGNAALANSGLDGPNFGSDCPVADWWLTDGTLRFIDGVVGGGACIMDCPLGDEMTAVIEDYDANGPPGVGGSAYYMGWAVTSTPAEGRYYDYGLVDGIASATTLNMLAFPLADVTASGRTGGNVDVTVDLADQSQMVHTWIGGGVAATSAVVSEWHLMKATGTADPGRLRSNWVKIATIPYVPGGTNKFQSVPCTDTVQDEFLAVGIGFNGGNFGTIDSALVGAAVALECDPFLAQPDDVKQEFKRKPAETELQANPGRSGGRR